VRISAQQGLLTGPATQLRLNQDGSTLSIRGTWSGRGLDITVGRLGLRGTMEQGGCTIQLQSAGAYTLSGTLGCSGRPDGVPSSSQGSLRFGGEAVLVPDVLLPQFILALLSALPI